MLARLVATTRASWRYPARMPTSDDEQRRVPFSEWLRARMEASGYGTTGDRPGGQVRLAADAGVSQSIISRALAGKSVPSPEALLRLSMTFGTPYAEALRAADLEPLAEHLEQLAVAEASQQEDPIIARIQHAAGLTPFARVQLIAFYSRRHKEAMRSLSQEMDEVIRIVGAVADDAGGVASE